MSRRVAVGIPSLPAPTVFLQFTWNEILDSRHGLSIHLFQDGGGYMQEIQGPTGSENQLGLGGTAFDGAAGPKRLLFDDLIVRAR